MHVHGDTACGTGATLLFSPLPAPASASARKGLVSPPKATHERRGAQARFAGHDSSPAAAAELAMSCFAKALLVALLWHDPNLNLSLPFPTKAKGQAVVPPHPSLPAGKRGRKKGAAGSTAMGAVQVGMPKAFHFPERFDISYAAAILSFCRN